MSRRKGFLIAAAVLGGFVALAVLLVSLAPEPERLPPPSRVPFVQTTAVIAGGDAIPVHGAGVVRPLVEVDLAPQVGGRVAWVAPQLRSGGRVAAGQILFRIDAADYDYQVHRAEAALQARRVELLEAEEAAAASADEYERFAARAGADAPPATPLALRQPQLEAARAALRREEAGLAHARRALSRTQVAAPFDGIVREERVDAGQLVTAHAAVGRIFSTAAVEVVVPLADAEASLVPRLWEDPPADGADRVAARVQVEYGDVRASWPGFVDRALAALDEATRTIEVVVRVPNPFDAGAGEQTRRRPPLLLGKFAEVIIDGVAPGEHFRLRRAALQPGDEVWCVRRDGTVRIVPVRVLQRLDDEVFVTGPLDVDEAAIVGGIRFATDGMAVRTADDQDSTPTPVQ